MDNKWTKISTKKYLLIILLTLVVLILIESIIGILFQYSTTLPMLLVFLFVFIIGVGYIFMGTSGFLTGKHSSIDPTFSDEYKVKHGQIQMREKIYRGFFGKSRSLISIIIGVVFLIIEGFVIFAILKK